MVLKMVIKLKIPLAYISKTVPLLCGSVGAVVIDRHRHTPLVTVLTTVTTVAWLVGFSLV